MLETLSAGFKRARERLAGVQTISDANLEEALADVRRALLEADVDYEVTKGFLERVREKSLGARVETKVRDEAGRVHRVSPGQHFVANCEAELSALMGPVDTSLA
jgi:signal recognition particle subunit SRP54